MIYTVECNFAVPDCEAEWNDFYNTDKLPALISVPGFQTSQRFKAVSRNSPMYLAIHSIDSPDVLTGAEYRRKGGGHFARWQPHITDWSRNLYTGIEIAPAIGADEYLAQSSYGPDALIQMGFSPWALHAVALEKSPQYRCFARLDQIPKHWPQDVHIYRPITVQLTNGHTASSMVMPD